MDATMLITSAGRRGQLVECFRESARDLGIRLRVIACDMRPELSAACQLADASAQVPSCRTPEFVPALLELCQQQGVQLVVPTIDTELQVLADARPRFAAIGVEVGVSDPAVVAAARDKIATAELLARAGVSTPATASARDFVAAPDTIGWPVILKPRGGSSSVGIVRPSDLDHALVAASRGEGLMVQRLLQGDEYTVNVYFDRAGQLRCAVPHRRIETRGGEVSKGVTEDVPALRAAARALANALTGARGALCFQAIVAASGEHAVFEINARFGGGYPLAHRAGARFTTWLLEELAGRPCTAQDAWRPGVTMLRYDAAVFLEG